LAEAIGPCGRISRRKRAKTYGSSAAARLQFHLRSLHFILQQVDRSPFQRISIPSSSRVDWLHRRGCFWRLRSARSRGVFAWASRRSRATRVLIFLKSDNVVADGCADGKRDLGLTNLETIESIAPTYLWRVPSPMASSTGRLTPTAHRYLNPIRTKHAENRPMAPFYAAD